MRGSVGRRLIAARHWRFPGPALGIARLPRRLSKSAFRFLVKSRINVGIFRNLNSINYLLARVLSAKLASFVSFSLISPSRMFVVSPRQSTAAAALGLPACAPAALARIKL